MVIRKYLITAAAAAMCVLQTATAQVVPNEPDLQLKKALAQIEQLASILAAQEARIAELEAARSGPHPASSAGGAAVVKVALAPETPMPMEAAPVALPEQAATGEQISQPPDLNLAADPHDHMVNLPGGGPALKIRGFFDFNFGVGSVANPLQYPLGRPAHSTFQAGEFDLFISSKLSNHLSFVSEMIRVRPG